MRALVHLYPIAHEPLLWRFIIAVLDECPQQFEAIFLSDRSAVVLVQLLPTPSLLALPLFVHLVSGILSDNGCGIIIPRFLGPGTRLRIRRTIVALHSDREPRIGVITQCPHQACRNDLSVNLFVVGAKLHFDWFFFHLRGQDLDLPVGTFDLSDLAGKLRSLSAHL